MSDSKQNTMSYVLAVLALFVCASVRAGEVPKGQQVFLDSKCNKCHSVDSLKITVLAPEEGDEAEEDEDSAAGAEEVKPPDLSNASKNFTKPADVEKWLTKKLEREGRKHRSKFRGSPEDLATLSKWIVTLKTVK